MKNLAHSLAITGILQSKRAGAVTEPIVTGTGSLVYDGLIPTFVASPLPIVIASPQTGSQLYTGLAPTADIIPPFGLIFTSVQETSVGDTPWRIVYQLYDLYNNPISTTTHNLNRGAVPSVFTRTTEYTAGINLPTRLDITVTRLLETFGAPPRDNRTNDAGSFIIFKTRGGSTSTIYSDSFTRNTRINIVTPVNGMISADTYSVYIWEG